MFEILVLISIVGVVSAIKMIRGENKRRKIAQTKLAEFKRRNPRKAK